MQTRSARLRAAAGQGVSSRAVPKTILAGSTFCIADERGDIDVPPAGLFAHDTRFLSRFVVLVNGARPELLTGRRGDPHEASYFSRNPLAGGLERDELEIVRRRRISVGLEEHFIVRNLGARQPRAGRRARARGGLRRHLRRQGARLQPRRRGRHDATPGSRPGRVRRRATHPSLRRHGLGPRDRDHLLAARRAHGRRARLPRLPCSACRVGARPPVRAGPGRRRGRGGRRGAAG